MNLKDGYEKYLAPSTMDFECPTIARACGIYLYDIFGKPYLNFDACVAVMPLGHRHPIIEEGLARQREKIDFVEGTARPWQIEISVGERDYEISPAVLAQKLASLTFPKEQARVAFDMTGATAIEAAQMFCMWERRDRHDFFAFRGGFHGRHGYARDLTLSKPMQTMHYPKGVRVTHLKFPRTMSDVQEIIQALKAHYPLENYNAVILEAVQGEGGIEVWDKSLWQEMEKFFKAYGIWIIADEVQCGVGRTGKMWGFQHLDMNPDIVVAGKGLGAGQPIGAMIYRCALEAEPLKRGWHSGTFPANPAHITSAILMLDILERYKLIDQVHDKGVYLMGGLQKLFAKKILEEPYPYCIQKGLGFMQGIEFRTGAGTANPSWRNQVYKDLQEEGIFTLPCGSDEKNPTIRFTPPYIIKKRDIDFVLNVLEKVL